MCSGPSTGFYRTCETIQLFEWDFWRLSEADDSYSLYYILGNSDSREDVANFGQPWDFSTPIDAWHGVTLEDNRVTKLELYQIPGVSGTLKDLDLPMLSTIVISSDFESRIVGEISFLNNFPNLEEVSIRYCFMTGNFSDLTANANLKVLNISDTFMGGELSETIPFPSLEALDLTGNKLTGVIPDFERMNRLLFLDLADNAFTGTIPNFSNLIALKYLDLNSIEFEDHVPNLSNLVHLEKLSLSYCELDITGSELDFSSNLKLERLFMNGNHLNSELPNLSYLPDLRSVGFGQCGLTKETDLSPLKRILEITGTRSSYVSVGSNCLSQDQIIYLQTSVANDNLFEELSWSTQKIRACTPDNLILSSSATDIFHIHDGGTYVFDFDKDVLDENAINIWYKDREEVDTTYGKELLVIDNFSEEDEGSYYFRSYNPKIKSEGYWHSDYISLYHGPFSIYTNGSVFLTECEEDNAFINLGVQGNRGEVSFVWEDGSTDDKRENLGEGIYYVTATDDYQNSLDTFTVVKTADFSHVEMDFNGPRWVSTGRGVNNPTEILTTVYSDEYQLLTYDKENRELETIDINLDGYCLVGAGQTIHDLNNGKYLYVDGEVNSYMELFLLDENYKSIATSNIRTTLEIIMEDSLGIYHYSYSGLGRYFVTENNVYVTKIESPSELKLFKYDLDLNIQDIVIVDLPNEFDHESYFYGHFEYHQNNQFLYSYSGIDERRVVFSFDDTGTILWEFSESNEGYLYSPIVTSSGIDLIKSFDGGFDRIVLDNDGNKISEKKYNYRLGTIKYTDDWYVSLLGTTYRFHDSDFIIFKEVLLPVNRGSSHFYVDDGRVYVYKTYDQNLKVFDFTPAEVCVSSCDSTEFVNFYEDMNGDDWITPWDLTEPIHTWDGIVFNEFGCITGVDLRGNNLSGCLQANYNIMSEYDFVLADNPSLPWQGGSDVEQIVLEQQIGAPCDDQDDQTENDVINSDCLCEGFPVTATNEIKPSSVDLSPNPVKNLITITTDFEISDVEIISIHGKKLRTLSVPSALDVSDLEPGVYIARIHAESHDSFVEKKFVKL